MPIESQLSHRVVKSANIGYVSNQSPTATDAIYVPGSQDILTSYSGFAQRRPGFADAVEMTPTVFNNLQRQFVWEAVGGVFILMACDISSAGFATVYKMVSGVDVSYIPIYTDTDSTPFDFVVSNNTCYFSNGNSAKKWTPADGVSNWGIAIGSVASAVGPDGAGTGSDVAVPGGTPWTNPGNITAADGSYATITLNASGGAISSGPFYGSTASGGVGPTAWTNPTYALADDGLCSTVTLASLDDSGLLALTGYNFAIPSSATITGIKLEIKRAGSAAARAQDESLQLLKAGVAVGTDKASASTWPGALAYATYGSSSDLWGTTWTAANINNSGFGVQLSAVNNSGFSVIAKVDAMRITVYYSMPSGNSVSDYLEATNFGFGLSATATIVGLNVFITGYQASSNASNTSLTVYLLKNGTVVGTGKLTPALGTASATVSFGGSSDLWGTSWTANDINQTTFGVALQANNNSGTNNCTFSIDFVQVTVYQLGGPSIVVSGSAGTMTATVGYQYVFCYGNSSTGHVSSPSPASLSTGTFTNKLKVSVDLTASDDPQVNQIRVFRSTDSVATGTVAGTFFELPNSPFSNTTATIDDDALDIALNQNSIAPTFTFNDPPLAMTSCAYFAGRIWGITGNSVIFSSLEENTIGVPEESFVSGRAGNFWTFNEPPQVLGVAGTGTDQKLAILCGGWIYGISGNTLDTFRRFVVSQRRGCRNVKSAVSLGGMMAWRDSSGQAWASDGSSLNEIGIDIRPDLTPYTPGTDCASFHVAGNFHWFIVSTGEELFVYDMDQQQWMPPWTFACTHLFSGETSPGHYDLLACTTTKALKLNISGSNNDNGVTYQPIGRTALMSLVPDFGTRFSATTLGNYDEPSRSGAPYYFEVDTNNVELSDVGYLNDDDPQIAATTDYKSVWAQQVPVEQSFLRNQGTNIKQVVFGEIQPTARWMSWQIKGKNADDQLKIYGFFMAYKQVR